MSEVGIDPAEITAVILAGGMGTRLRTVIGERPKPMAEVNGRPFLEWVLSHLRGNGIRRAVIAAGYRAEVIGAHFARREFPGMEVLTANETNPLGTAGGFRHAVKTSGTQAANWLVLNGDSLVAAPLAGLLDWRRNADFFAGLMSVWMDDAARYGSLETQGEPERLAAFAEKQPGPAWINSGIYFLSDEAARSLPDRAPLSWEKDVFAHWLAEGKDIRIARVRAPFLDIGIPEDFAKAGRFLEDAGFSTR